MIRREPAKEVHMPDIVSTTLPGKLGVRVMAERFRQSLESELAEGFLQILLRLMSLVFFLSKDFRRNIEDFKGKYIFRSKDNSIQTSVLFEGGRMRVKENLIDHPNVTIVFRNSKALMSYLLSPKPDILGSLLRQDVVVDGNFNYLYKFAFMAKRLQLMVTGPA
jgi:hypothetical protein